MGLNPSDSIQYLERIVDLLDNIANPSPDYIKPFTVDLGVIAVTSMVVSIVSAIYTWKGYRSQQQTETNTNNIQDKDVSRWLTDLIRHFYRDLVVVCAIERKLNESYTSKEGNYTAYPSEEHFYKLVPMCDWMRLVNSRQLGMAIDQHDGVLSLPDLQVLFRNFEIEVKVACEHFKNPNLSIKTKKRDLNTLKFKACFLANQTYNVLEMHVLSAGNKGQSATDVIRSVREYVQGHTNYWSTVQTADVEPRAKFQAKDLGFFSSALFVDDQTFIDCFNRDVDIECGNNIGGNAKIHFIEF